MVEREHSGIIGRVNWFLRFLSLNTSAHLFIRTSRHFLGAAFFSQCFQVFSLPSTPTVKTSTVRTPPMKPNKVLKNNSSGENISQSLWLIGNKWHILWTPLEVFSLRNWEAVPVLAVSAFYSEMYEKLTCKVRFRQVVENDVLLPPWMGYNKTTWKFPVSWGLRARVVTRPTIRQQKHRTCETGFTHAEHLNIVILNMSEYDEILKI